MKTILYFRTEDFNYSTHSVEVTIIAKSYNQSTQFKLYQMTSEIYDEDQIKQRYEDKLIFLSEVEALAFGKELQPDRVKPDDITGEEINFTFNLPDWDFIRLAKLKMTDAKIPRGLEELYDLLIAKKIIKLGDSVYLDSDIANKKDKRDKL